MREETYFLSHLLPYSLGSRKGRTLVLQSLKEYLFLLIATEQALESFRLGKLTDFDALVGENACQIRAVKLALIVRENKLDVLHLMKNVLESKKIVEEHINNNLSQFKKGPVSLACIFAKDPIDIDLCYRGLYLVKTYILTKVQDFKFARSQNSSTIDGYEKVINGCTNVKKTKEIGDVSTTFAEKYIKLSRQRLSRSSVDFVKNILSEIDDSPLRKEYLELDNFSIIHKDLTCIPCYWSMGILVQKVLRESIPFVLLVDQKAKNENYNTIQRGKIFFKTTSHGCEEVCTSLLEDNQPIIVFQGNICRNLEEFSSVDWKKELLKNSPIDLILACAAAHPQYPIDPPSELLRKISQEHRYNYHLYKAQEWGCEINNPSGFLLTHVFCDKICNVRSY